MCDRFWEYYHDLYGSRWPDLYRALQLPAQRVAYDEGLLKPYYLDAASIAVARLLSLKGARDVLDLCAAPGGKSLLLATVLEPGARLVANERSATRRGRMKRVFAEHLPADLLGRVEVTGHDARRWGLHEPASFDVVLADVPCSAERHLVLSPGGTGNWNPRRSKQLAIDQFAILAAAVDSCRAGGQVLYATCTLSPMENDAVVAKALKRRAVSLIPISLDEEYSGNIEQGAYGIHLLPDCNTASGPMYAALLQKH